MDDYPQLSEMGIRNPLQIDRYQVNSIGNHDVLRIIYEREGVLLLPSTRTYEFPRVQRSVPTGKDGGKTQTVMEMHPNLKKATRELEKLFATKEQKECVAETVIGEIERLEEEVTMRIAYIKDLVKRL